MAERQRPPWQALTAGARGSSEAAAAAATPPASPSPASPRPAPPAFPPTSASDHYQVTEVRGHRQDVEGRHFYWVAWGDSWVQQADLTPTALAEYWQLRGQEPPADPPLQRKAPGRKGQARPAAAQHRGKRAAAEQGAAGLQGAAQQAATPGGRRKSRRLAWLAATDPDSLSALD